MADSDNARSRVSDALHLRHGDLDVLEVIGDGAPNPPESHGLSLREIADALGRTRSDITETTQRLGDASLCTTQRTPTTTSAHVTDKGNGVLDCLHNSYADTIRSLTCSSRSKQAPDEVVIHQTYSKTLTTHLLVLEHLWFSPGLLTNNIPPPPNHPPGGQGRG